MDNYNSTEFSQKKKFFQNLLTIYGRKPVLECLRDESIEFFKVHLATSNKRAKIIDDIEKCCQQRQIEICYHDKKALSRISKNSRQDQGVAADLSCSGYQDYQDFIKEKRSSYELLALDSITNPQNLGMIIRSVCASGIAGILLPRKGCAALDPLVIKASAGTLFKTRILRCDSLAEALADFSENECKVYGLSSHAEKSVSTIGDANSDEGKSIFILGNESSGVNPDLMRLCHEEVSIPMSNGVESLNVAVTAALLSFRHVMQK